MTRLLVQVALWTSGLVFGGYSAFVALLMIPYLQRFALYANKFNTARLRNPDVPERWGFAEKQVTPFRIKTPDGVTLYAWHVLPLGLYSDHRQSLLAEVKNDSQKITRDKLALKLLQNVDSRVIVYFHGNAGCVADGWRPDSYKALSTCDSKRTHIITFDYRGFGLSSSKLPSESGLIIDGIAAVNWVMEEAKVPVDRIVLLGHSLGTAVAAAVAEHFASSSPSSTFAGIVLASGFSDIPTLMKTYLIGGLVPVLSPLTRLPRLQNFIAANIVDTWDTARRLRRVTALSPRLNLEMIHAKNDYDIGWKHSDVLYNAAVAGISGDESNTKHNGFEEGEVVRIFDCPGKLVKRTLLDFGGHNQILSYAPVALAVHAAFEKSLRS